ncbi:hypothetical protein HU200_013862 [Digitaria exilis]|uniref:UDP-glycosyltransferases domain-containing protein n=1 Tax=Digitaria exilis TaxID=1010633 RepID=A0A835KKN7_9POAL|nr:hypothetical protein HU200_013862 [Digitaria exilis]
MARPHVVVVPYPGSGNINPALQIAKLLHSHGVYVTFVNTEHNHRRFQDTEGAAAVQGRDGFRFEAIPDGLSEAERGKQDYGRGLAVSTSTLCAAPFRRVIERLNGTPGVPRVTCVLPTMLMSFALGVARELGIPTMAFWTGSAAALMTHMMLRDLQDRGYVPLKDESYLTNGYLDKTVIDWIPGMPPISLGDFSSFLRTTDPNDFGLRFNESEANNCTKAGALILNTFDALEADVLAALRAQYPRIYTIGPQGSLLRHTLDDRATNDSSSTGLSLWKQNAECLAWLDMQEQRSVVYVNFGSHTVLSPEQLAEFAWGLAASGHSFLWSIRDNLVCGGGGGGVAMLLLSFTDEMAGRCHLTSWCPQEQVLRHPAVGCFVTHSGWNSTCESVAAGVPMVCWPGFADQYTNCKYACDVWGVGVRLDAEVRREQVSEHVREVMASEEMRRSASKWKEEAETAVSPGGSSFENLMSMVRALSAYVVIKRPTSLAGMAKPHVVVVPYPGSGNINPALQIAKLLHRHGVCVTFVNTEHSHRHFQDTEGANAVVCRDGFGFEAIPDGLSEADRDKQDYGRSIEVSTSTRCATPLKRLIERLNGTPGVPKVTCVLPTMLMSFALDVARELGIPTVSFWAGSAASLMTHMRLRELQERGYVPLKGDRGSPRRLPRPSQPLPLLHAVARADLRKPGNRGAPARQAGTAHGTMAGSHGWLGRGRIRPPPLRISPRSRAAARLLTLASCAEADPGALPPPSDSGGQEEASPGGRTVAGSPPATGGCGGRWDLGFRVWGAGIVGVASRPSGLEGWPGVAARPAVVVVGGRRGEAAAAPPAGWWRKAVGKGWRRGSQWDRPGEAGLARREPAPPETEQEGGAGEVAGEMVVAAVEPEKEKGGGWERKEGKRRTGGEERAYRRRSRGWRRGRAAALWMRRVAGRKKGPPCCPGFDASLPAVDWIQRRRKTVIDWVPGMPPISLGDFSSFLRTTDPNDFGLRFNESAANNCTKAGALVLNTFDALEADPRIYTIGPLGSLLRQNRDIATDDSSTGLSLWKQDDECLAWLDTQEPRSVVYVNFGSNTVLSPEQLAEFAWDLAASGHPFLWSIRDNLVAGGGGAVDTLPPAFMAETSGRCHLTSWCQQEQVLRHPAVGCFLTHSGWNSTCESLTAGVPMVCWPGFSDQYTNAKYAYEVWGVGVRLDAVVRREQVSEHIREDGKKEMRRKEEAETAVSSGGSSFENLLSMAAHRGGAVPGRRHINPALQLAKLLHRHGAYVTFVNTEHNHRRVQETEGAGAMRGQQDFRFEDQGTINKNTRHSIWWATNFRTSRRPRTPWLLKDVYLGLHFSNSAQH